MLSDIMIEEHYRDFVMTLCVLDFEAIEVVKAQLQPLLRQSQQKSSAFLVSFRWFFRVPTTYVLVEK